MGAYAISVDRNDDVIYLKRITNKNLCFHDKNGGGISDITLSSFTLFPKSIEETFKLKLMNIFSSHFRPDPDTRVWKMEVYPGQTYTNLVHKCQLVLSLIMGGEATKINEPSDMCSTILNLCKKYFRDHYFMRQRLGL